MHIQRRWKTKTAVTKPGGCRWNRRKQQTSDKKDGTTYMIDRMRSGCIGDSKKNNTRKINICRFSVIRSNTVIKTYGNRTRTVNLELRRPFRWQFIVADVRQLIIGADFLAHYGILPDLKNRRFVDGQTLLSSIARVTTGKQTVVATINEGCKVKEIL